MLKIEVQKDGMMPLLQEFCLDLASDGVVRAAVTDEDNAHEVCTPRSVLALEKPAPKVMSHSIGFSGGSLDLKW